MTLEFSSDRFFPSTKISYQVKKSTEHETIVFKNSSISTVEIRDAPTINQKLQVFSFILADLYSLLAHKCQ